MQPKTNEITTEWTSLGKENVAMNFIPEAVTVEDCIQYKKTEGKGVILHNGEVMGFEE